MSNLPSGRARWRWLRSAARRLRAHPRHTLAHVIALGKLLTAVKRVVGHGAWRPWLAEHWPHSYRVAAEAMRAAIELDGQTCTARKFGPSAARVLANGTIPKRKRLNALQSKGAAAPIGNTGALLLISGDDGDLSRFSAAILEMKPDARPADVSEEERAYLQLAELASAAGMLHLSIDRNPDSPSVTIAIYPDDGPRRHVVRPDLAGALAAASGQEETRRCPRCGKELLPAAFAKSTSYCRICERARVKAATAKKGD